MAFFVGYLLAAVGPVAAGALRDATGGFHPPVFATLVVLGFATLAAALATLQATPTETFYSLRIMAAPGVIRAPAFEAGGTSAGGSMESVASPYRRYGVGLCI